MKDFSLLKQSWQAACVLGKKRVFVLCAGRSTLSIRP